MRTFLHITASLLLSATAYAAEPIWDGNKVNMISEKLATDVYAFYADNARELNASGGAAATSSGLIVGSRGALLVDTMLNKRLNAQVQALTRKATKLPLLYAVNTSAHGDHSYGNMYLPAQTRVIQHAHTQNFIATSLDADKAFMLKNFGDGRGIEEIHAHPADLIVPAGGKIVVDLGGKQVEIIDFGFAQTGGDLFVWEPASRVMWAGNPVIAKKPALPWLLDGHLVETLETMRKVYDFLPSDARIVPGHGVALSREDLKWHINYLATIEQNVRAAITEGLSQEETVRRVTMPDYRGYVLFDWVHNSLNVPAAYKDLTTPKQ
ncbi:MAG: MBL fold metallo-hydrolase [Rhodanobacteraceae bacterium]|nr:MBL fold metallo-hydrolase [Rhodanobacteraceae bacterium]